MNNLNLWIASKSIQTLGFP
uniref:Uncharacterized protein n=1 Tax=Arundo donax TaxID=35708 RepID=A0A0A9AY19_ARUDO